MQVVSTQGGRAGVTVWVADDERAATAPRPLKLTYAEAAALMRDLSSALATHLDRGEA